MKKGFAACFALVALSGSTAIARADTFDYTGSVVDWFAPVTGTYAITAIGAQGGAGTACCGVVGGLGAEMYGELSLNVGDELQIAVGGMGASSYGNGGGGGGTFIVDASNNPLLIAGGGGGLRAYAGQNGTDASITTSGYYGSCGSTGYTPSLEGNSGTGCVTPCASWGSSGAGFYSNGANDS